MTNYPNPNEPYDPDGLDPDPFAPPFGVIGEPIAGFTPNMTESAMVAPEDQLNRKPGTEVPGPTRRRDRDYKIPRAAPRDILG